MPGSISHQLAQMSETYHSTFAKLQQLRSQGLWRLKQDLDQRYKDLANSIWWQPWLPLLCSIAEGACQFGSGYFKAPSPPWKVTQLFMGDKKFQKEWNTYLFKRNGLRHIAPKFLEGISGAITKTGFEGPQTHLNGEIRTKESTGDKFFDQQGPMQNLQQLAEMAKSAAQAEQARIRG